MVNCFAGAIILRESLDTCRSTWRGLVVCAAPEDVGRRILPTSLPCRGTLAGICPNLVQRLCEKPNKTLLLFWIWSHAREAAMRGRSLRFRLLRASWVSGWQRS